MDIPFAEKAVKQATRMALLSKFQDDEVTMLDGLSVEGPRTKVIADMLKSLGLSATDCLLVIDGYDANVWISSKNIPTLRVSPASDLNAYDLLRQKQLLITTAAMDSLRGGQVAVGVEE